MRAIRRMLPLCVVIALVVAGVLAWRLSRTAPPSVREASTYDSAPARATLTPAQQALSAAMADTPPDRRQGFFVLPAAMADLARESLRSVVDRLQRRAQAGDAAALRRLSDIGFSCYLELQGERSRQAFHRSGPPSAALAPCQELSDDEVAGYADTLYAAARAGDVEARRRLRMRVDKVRGDAAHRQQARDDTVTWLRELARAGDPQAMLELAQEATLGKLLPRDLVYAYACYLQALPRLRGDKERKEAEFLMDLLRDRLTDGDVARARERAASPAPFD